MDTALDSAMVLTLTGDDRPGVVEQVAQRVAARQGRWLKSEFSCLDGKFAGIVQIEVPLAERRTLMRDLEALAGKHLRLQIGDGHPAPVAGSYPLTLRFVGMDRRGVVTEISAILARYGVSIRSLNSRCVPAPMSSELLFQAEFQVQVPLKVGCHQLCDALEALTPELMVDWETQTAVAM